MPDCSIEKLANSLAIDIKLAKICSMYGLSIDSHGIPRRFGSNVNSSNALVGHDGMPVVTTKTAKSALDNRLRPQCLELETDSNVDA